MTKIHPANARVGHLRYVLEVEQPEMIINMVNGSMVRMLKLLLDVKS